MTWRQDPNRPAALGRVSLPGRRPTAARLALVLAMGLGACRAEGARTGSTSRASATPAAAPLPLRIAAASSLAEPFDALGEAFARAEGLPPPLFDFDASSSLAARLAEGAPVDVFAAADAVSMDRVAEAPGLAAPAAVLATNRLALIVPKGNRARVRGLADLERAGLLLATCDPQVPIGHYTQELFAAAGIAPQAASLEANVKGIVAKVALGEVDAGVVYATDALAAVDKVEEVPFPEELSPRAAYHIGIVAKAADRDSAEAFVAFALGPVGQAVLARAGFGPP